MLEGFYVVLVLLQYKVYCYGICSSDKITMDSHARVVEALDFHENIADVLLL
jgi:hypothetical protein